MKDYLPTDSPSTEAMDVMEDEFFSSTPDTNVMIYDVTIQEALDFKEKLAAIDGVTDVTWLDDAADIRTPIEMIDEDTVETYYKDNHALFSFGIRDGEEVEVTDAIYELIGEDNAMAGESLNTRSEERRVGKECRCVCTQ